MRRISTGREQLLTTHAVADAVVSYAAALARNGTSDTVTIPIVRDDGGIDTARLLIGPASQLTIVPARSDTTTLPGADAVVRDLDARCARLEPRAGAGEPLPVEVESAFPDFDADV